MPYEADRRQKMEDQLDISDERKQLDLGKRKVTVNKETFSLVIGLGGMGSQAVVETKGLIGLTCEHPETNVAYLAFDTDEYTRRIRSSAKTGSVRLDHETGNHELVLLDSQGLGGAFAAPNIETVHTTNPEIFDWVDTDLSPIGAPAGAYGIRQLGRLILLKDNYASVHDAISDAVLRLMHQAWAQGAGHPHLNVYIVSGISGGTGSGMFLDLAYIVRAVLNGIAGFGAHDRTIYGYLFMPDVNMDQPWTNREVLQRNAYAALQELDYNLSLEDLGESYDLKWQQDVYRAGIDRERVFDFVHLVSAAMANGAMMRNAYEASMQTVAQNILTFVADETTTPAAFMPAAAAECYYRNITDEIDKYEQTQARLAHRNASYLATGSYSYDLPIDDIMMYTASMFFGKMEAMIAQRPNAEECKDFAGQIMMNPQNIVAAIVGRLPQFRARMATDFRHPEVDFEARARANEYDVVGNPALRTQLDHVAYDVIKAINTSFDKNLKVFFADKNRGPVYANDLIMNAEYGLLEQIREWIGYNACLPGEFLDHYCESELAAYRKAKEEAHRVVFFIRDAKLAAYNETGMRLFEKATYYTLREYIKKVLLGVSEHIREQNSVLYGVVGGTMVTMRDIFAENAQIMQDDGFVHGMPVGLCFNWQPITIPRIADYLQSKFDAIFNEPGSDLIRDFLDSLWTEATEKWMRDDDLYDPRGFVSSFINDKFGSLAQMSLEDVVTELLAPGQSLQQACDLLMEKLQTESAPLFYRSWDVPAAGETVMLISVPAGCPNILNAISAIAPRNAIIQKSSIRDRIYAQTVQCGVTLAHYQLVWAAEACYAQHRDDHGLHLVDPKGRYAPEDPVRWTEMSTLIPHYLRPQQIANVHVTEMVAEEEREKHILIDCFESDGQGIYTAKFKTAELDTTSALDCWIVRLYTTDVEPVVERDTLKLMRGHTTIYTCGSYSLTPEIDLQGFIENGLWTADPNTVKKTIEYIQRVSHHPNPVRSAETTMDFLAEKFVTAIYAKHAFKHELEKYRVISDYLKTLQAHAEG